MGLIVSEPLVFFCHVDYGMGFFFSKEYTPGKNVFFDSFFSDIYLFFNPPIRSILFSIDRLNSRTYSIPSLISLFII